MSSPVHQQAMSKIAAAMALMPAPSDAPEKQKEEPGLRVALYYDTARDAAGDVHCHFYLKYPSGGIAMKKKNRKHSSVFTFPTGDMTDDRIASEVVIRAVDKITKDNISTVKVYVEQELLRTKFTEALPLVPILRLLDKDDFEGELLCQYARAKVKERTRYIEQTYKRQYRLKQQGLTSAGLSLERTLYIDASCGTDRAKIGYGYVIKDVVGDHTGKKAWNLIYGSGISTVPPQYGSTGAELKAIKNTILTGGVFDTNVRDGHRSLTVYCDSLWSVRIINAKRRGTDPKIHEDVMPQWDKMATEILEAIGNAPNVNFFWVKGHSNDVLNNAADRLAVAARRGMESGFTPEMMTSTKDSIAKGMIADLTKAGLEVTATEHKHSSNTDWGSPMPQTDSED